MGVQARIGKLAAREGFYGTPINYEWGRRLEMRSKRFKGILLSTLIIASLTALAISTMSLPSASLTSAQLNPENIAIIHSIENENVYHITLITGDVVIVSDAGAGQRTFQFIPADPNTGSAFQTFKGPDGTYVFPSGADLNKLDKELFNIDYLIEQGYNEMAYLPVIVSVTDEPSKNVGGRSIQDIERSAQTLDSIKAGIESLEGEVTINSPMLSTLAAKLSVDNIEESTKMLLERSDVKKIWLDKKVHVSLDNSVPLIGAPELWATGDNGAGIKIAILDTGIDATHPDLEYLDDNVTPKVTVAVNFTDDNSADDFFGHGTHCAGIAAGTGKASGYLYRGVAPGAYLWNVKVLDHSGSGYDSWIISGIQYAALGPDGVENTGDEADVISMSFGADMNGDGTDSISTAVDWATDRGVVCVAAAGNSGPSMFTVGMPAVARKVITVGATTKTDTMAGFSSRGPTADYRLKPDVVAPGVYIVAPRASGTSMGYPVNDYYTSASGTSMSTPHVAGAAALLLQTHPDWNPIMVKSALMGNAKVLENVHLWEQGAGRIQVPEAENTGLIAVEPSLSFGTLSSGENKVATLTLINLTNSAENVSISTYTRCDNVETDYVSVNPASLIIGAHENAEVLVQVGPLDENAPEGWYEGWINVTYDHRTLKVPLLFAAVSTVSVDIYDLDNSEVSAMVVLATYPDMAFTSFSWETPVQLYVKSGDYAVLAQCAWVEKGGHWPPEWQRMFMIEKTISVPRLSEVHVEMRLAEAPVKEIRTVDNSGENLIVHCYTQYFSGSPYFENIVGVTMMRWSMGGAWSGFDINTDSLTLYSSVYDPAENLSQSFGFYASDNLLSKVYLLDWKYRNVPSLPSTITYDYSYLAKYDVHYDMPETYPENGLNSVNAFWFTWENMGGFQGWDWDTHKVPAGLAEYYLAPWSATYWGIYMPWYEGWDYPDFGPLQEWAIGRHYPYPQIPPENGETGSLVLGDFQFAPYIPGLSLDILENGSYTTLLTGDMWGNLTWPHWQWYMLYPLEGLISPYPQDQEPQYYLYVDNLLVASGTFGRIDVDEGLGIWWDNIENSWDVTGGMARLELYMPSLATISKWTTYTLSFNLADNVHIPPIFDNIVMPLSYSPNENITVRLETPTGIENITFEYSFDSGAIWEAALEIPQGYLIPCEMADGLAIRISASDQHGNSLVYTSSPVALCKRVVLSAPEQVLARLGDTVEISGGLTTIEGEGLRGLAVALFSNDNKISTYASTNENGFFTLTCTAPPAVGEYDFVITSPSVGVYQSSEASVRLIVKNFLKVSVSPFVNLGEAGDNLFYDAMVTNVGSEADNYIITVTDNLAWQISISENEITLAPGENTVIVVRVTVPENLTEKVADWITLKASGVSGAENSADFRAINVFPGPNPPYPIVPGLPHFLGPGIPTLTVDLPAVPIITAIGSGYSIDLTPREPWPLLYGEGEFAPVAAAALVDNGRVVALPSILRDRYFDRAELANQEVMSDIAQWIVDWDDPEGDNFLYFVAGPGVYHTPSVVTKWLAMLENLGFDVSTQVDGEITSNLLENIDVLNIAELMRPLSTDEIQAVANWVRAGGKLIIMCQGDYAGYSMPDYPNGVLENLNCPIRFQDDELYDDNSWVVDGPWFPQVYLLDPRGANLEFDMWFPILRGVGVSISPSYQSSLPGATLNYTVAVVNTGGFTDNYALTVSDNSGWGPTLEDNLLEVPAGENRQTTLSVIIPAGAENCTRDSITVTATSQTDNTVRDNASCIAHAVAAPPPPPPQLPTQPQLSSPSNGSEVSTKTPTLRWENGMYAENHRVLLDDDPNPDDNPLYDQTIIGDDKWTTPTLTEDETYYWKVIAQNENGENHSVTWHFTVNAEGPSPPPSPPPPGDTVPPPTPSLVSPASGANITDNTPLFDWSDVSDPSGVTYDMSIARDAGFASIALQKTGLTASTYELTPAEALAAGAYYWRARAVDGAGNIGSWSENWSFTVSIAPPTPPSVEIPLITPEAPATVDVENAAITELEISVLNTVENVRITVQELVDRPGEIAIAAPGAIYRYLEIIKENITDNDIGSVTITFKVEKAWIEGENIDENTITLKRYNPENGGWVSLPTAKVSEDATYVYFSATSPGLSYFAVSGTAMTPAPAAFTVSALTISPSQVSVGEEVSISVTVTNTGGTVGTSTVTLKINGAVKAIENVTLAGGATELVVFTVAGDKEGTYSVEVNGLAGTFTVITPPIGLALLIGIVVAIAIITIGATIILRRQKLRRILQIG
jgi:PGF-pre-PGF domain-containing protein